MKGQGCQGEYTHVSTLTFQKESRCLRFQLFITPQLWGREGIIAGTYGRSTSTTIFNLTNIITPCTSLSQETFVRDSRHVCSQSAGISAASSYLPLSARPRQLCEPLSVLHRFLLRMERRDGSLRGSPRMLGPLRPALTMPTSLDAGGPALLPANERRPRTAGVHASGCFSNVEMELLTGTATIKGAEENKVGDKCRERGALGR